MVVIPLLVQAFARFAQVVPILVLVPVRAFHVALDILLPKKAVLNVCPAVSARLCPLPMLVLVFHANQDIIHPKQALQNVYNAATTPTVMLGHHIRCKRTS